MTGTCHQFPGIAWPLTSTTNVYIIVLKHHVALFTFTIMLLFNIYLSQYLKTSYYLYVHSYKTLLKILSISNVLMTKGSIVWRPSMGNSMTSLMEHA